LLVTQPQVGREFANKHIPGQRNEQQQQRYTDELDPNTIF
jgi:hypothetical protein